MAPVCVGAKFLGQGAGVDLGQFGHFGAMVETALVPESANMPLAQ
jgi:hypothetical protein